MQRKYEYVPEMRTKSAIGITLARNRQLLTANRSWI